MRSASATPMPASGSSSSSTWGAVASVIAISSWRCSPWLMVPATACVRDRRPATSMACSARSRVARVDSEFDSVLRSQFNGIQGFSLERDCAARRTFSHTVNGRKIFVFW